MTGPQGDTGRLARPTSAWAGGHLHFTTSLTKGTRLLLPSFAHVTCWRRSQCSSHTWSKRLEHGRKENLQPSVTAAVSSCSQLFPAVSRRTGEAIITAVAARRHQRVAPGVGVNCLPLTHKHRIFDAPKSCKMWNSVQLCCSGNNDGDSGGGAGTE